jgi:hypothetical protein
LRRPPRGSYFLRAWNASRHVVDVTLTSRTA